MSTTTSSSKIALVTGGSRGLGRATAHALAADGHGVVITYIANRAAADAVVAEIAALGQKAVAVQLDCGKVSTFGAFATTLAAALTSTWGVETFDFLVNNAGQGIYAPIIQTTEAQFDDLMNVHFKGVFFLTQTLAPIMNDGGRIVNLSSGLTRFVGPGYGAYASMKGAIEVFTRYLAVELGKRGIAVNTFAPGAIETDFGGGTVRDNENVNKHIASVTALGRVGMPGDIGPAIASLLSDANRWVNAQRIEASGGQSAVRTEGIIRSARMVLASWRRRSFAMPRISTPSMMRKPPMRMRRFSRATASSRRSVPRAKCRKSRTASSTRAAVSYSRDW